MWTGLARFALGLGLFFSIFGLRFCTSNSSSLLRFVAFVMLVEFLDAFALGRAASFGTSELRGTLFARRIPRRFCARQPFVEFLVAFALVQ